MIVNKEEFERYVISESKRRSIFCLRTKPFDSFGDGRPMKILYIDKDQFFKFGIVSTIAWTYEYEPKGFNKNLCLKEEEREYYIVD